MCLLNGVPLSRDDGLMRIAVIFVMTGFVHGCFWASTPPSRPQSVPEIVPGEEMTYESSSFQTGVDGDGPTYGHQASAKYRGRELTQNEFSMLVDPSYVEKAKKYDELRSACSRANVLKYVAAFAVIGGVVAYPSLDGKVDNTTRILVSGGLVVGGLAVGALAYFTGGNRCGAASELGDTIGATRFDDTNLLGSFAGQLDVDKFNERYGIKKPTEPTPTDDVPAEKSPENE